jgi:shikimate dehydrogenase
MPKPLAYLTDTLREIGGRTAIWAIVADPIGQVKTPQQLNALMGRRGIDGVMVPLHVTAADLPLVVTGLRRMGNLHGFVVTVPHKCEMVSLCDVVTNRGIAIGAVNVVRREKDGRLVGDNLDGTGFVRGLIEAGIDPAGRNVYCAGVGGAGAAIAFALAEAGVARLTIANRTAAKAIELRDRLARFHPALPVAIGTADPVGHDLLVNATSLGMRVTDPLPFDVASLSPDQIVADIIMDPETTPLLAAAASRGCRTHNGFAMLASQLELMAGFMGMTIDGPA